jgi:hypothetical protein
MSGAIPPLPQYAFMAWCLIEAQGQLYLYLLHGGLVTFEVWILLSYSTYVLCLSCTKWEVDTKCFYVRVGSFNRWTDLYDGNWTNPRILHEYFFLRADRLPTLRQWHFKLTCTKDDVLWILLRLKESRLPAIDIRIDTWCREMEECHGNIVS